MPVKKRHISTAPKRLRNQLTTFEKQPEWLELRAALAEHLKNGEVFDVSFTSEQRKMSGLINLKTAKRFIQAHIKQLGLPYSVTCMNTSEGEVIRVSYEPVIAQTA